jgi:hypothetical protein
MRTGGGPRKALSCTAWRRDGRRSRGSQGLAKGDGAERGHNQGLAIERRKLAPSWGGRSVEWNGREALEIKAWRDGHGTGGSIKGAVEKGGAEEGNTPKALVTTRATGVPLRGWRNRTEGRE